MVGVSGGAFDPLAALRTLDRHGVRYVLIGGLGARLHGSPSVTNDTDVCYERSPENLEHLAAALTELHARLRGIEDDVPFHLDAATLGAGDHFTFSTDAGNLDCLGTPAGVDGYGDLAANAETYEIEGLRVMVASIADLIRMKRAAARPKDLLEIDILRTVEEERGSR
jgi:hypothetical protein